MTFLPYLPRICDIQTPNFCYTFVPYFAPANLDCPMPLFFSPGHKGLCWLENSSRLSLPRHAVISLFTTTMTTTAATVATIQNIHTASPHIFSPWIGIWSSFRSGRIAAYLGFDSMGLEGIVHSRHSSLTEHLLACGARSLVQELLREGDFLVEGRAPSLPPVSLRPPRCRSFPDCHPYLLRRLALGEDRRRGTYES